MIRQSDQHYRAPKGGGRFGGKTYREGQRIPARYGRMLEDGSRLTKDPSEGNDAVPPGYSKDVIPHIWTFQSLISTVSHVYRNPDEAIKHSLENARFMRNDCAIMECLEARQRMVALLNWHIESDDMEDQQQVQLCTDMTAVMKSIPQFTEYRRNLQEAIWYGKSAIQHIFGFKRIAGKKRVVIKSWKPVNGDKLAFRFDDGSAKYSDNEVGIKVSTIWPLRDIVLGNRKLEFTEYGPAYFLEPWERTRLCVHKHIIEDGSYEDPISSGRIHGVGIRDRIYWAWFQKQDVMAHLMEIIERTGSGFTIYYYPAGNMKAKTEIEEVAQKQTHTNVLIMPRTPGDPAMDAYGLDRIEPSTGGVTVLQDIVSTFFGNQIKRYILGQTLSSEADSTGLGSGVADLHLETLLQIIQYDALKQEETITCETLRPLQNYCFPWSRDIELRFVIDTESSESETKMRAFKEAWDMGTKIKAADVYDTIGASMPTEDEEVLQNPAMQQQQRLWDQTHGDGGDPMAGGPDGATPEGPDGEPDMQGMFGPLMDQIGGGEQEGGPEQYAKRLKSSPGQKSLTWTDEDEKKHPRDEDGKFASKESGGEKSKEPRRAVGKFDDRELSQTEETDRKFVENFADVSADPEKATSRNLHRARSYLESMKQHYIRQAQRGEITEAVRDERFDSADRESEWYKQILKRRGDYSGGGPYSDEKPAADGEFTTKDEGEHADPDKAKWRENLEVDAETRRRKDDEIAMTDEQLQDSKRNTRKNREKQNQDKLPTDEQVEAEKAKYGDEGFAERGMDAYRAALDGKFTKEELDAADKWIQDKFGTFGTVGRFIRGEVRSAAPKDVLPTSPSKKKDGVTYQQAKAGGEISPVNGEFYKGGRWMPIHGLSPKVDKSKPPKSKGNGPPEAGKGKDKPPREPRREMSAEQIEAEKQRRETDAKWDGVRTGPLASALWVGEKPGKTGFDVKKKMVPYLTSLKPEQVKKIAEHVKAKAIERERPNFENHYGAGDEADRELNAWWDDAKSNTAAMLLKKKDLKAFPGLDDAVEGLREFSHPNTGHVSLEEFVQLDSKLRELLK